MKNEDVTAASGIAFTYRNGEEVKPPHLAILESIGQCSREEQFAQVKQAKGRAAPEEGRASLALLCCPDSLKFFRDKPP